MMLAACWSLRIRFSARAARAALPYVVNASSISRQLPLSPVVILAIGVERALNVSVQRSHDADACEHRRTARRRHQAKSG
jgi:hypothetical protein